MLGATTGVIGPLTSWPAKTQDSIPDPEFPHADKISIRPTTCIILLRPLQLLDSQAPGFPTGSRTPTRTRFLIWPPTGVICPLTLWPGKLQDLRQLIPWYYGTMVPWRHGTRVPGYHGTTVPWYHCAKFSERNVLEQCTMGKLLMLSRVEPPAQEICCR